VTPAPYIIKWWVVWFGVFLVFGFVLGAVLVVGALQVVQLQIQFFKISFLFFV
jgi:hypothetical protein